MHETPAHPRSTSLQGGSALLAVLAILMAAPAFGGGSVVQGPVGLSLARMVTAPAVARVFVIAAPTAESPAADRLVARTGMGPGQGSRAHDALDRLGPLRLVLPPPFAC